MKVTPQQEQILAIHRDQQWHCSTEYEFLRDHRKRISELNEGYLKEKGFKLVGKRCDGRCGKNHKAPLFMRRAEKVGPSRAEILADNKKAIAFFDNYQKTP